MRSLCTSEGVSFRDCDLEFEDITHFVYGFIAEELEPEETVLLFENCSFRALPETGPHMHVSDSSEGAR